MKIAKGDERREARVRLAFRLQMKHAIEIAQIAEVLGLSEKGYRDRVRRLKLEADKLNMPTAADHALERLQAELRKLIEGEELPDKSKAEALMALARAVKTVGELASETGSSRQEENAGTVVSLSELRQVLARIDRRIEELAQRRAREILGGGLDAKADIGGGKRMADKGA
ncbi:hypothetical protein KUG47_03870 [Falsochrobactrum sp. TDYN1]|uniref:Uncharacterized protein n=1 Tax=Falsochrobactrum tianjinense TaxID=2706015 RepID=A0A949UTR6_9HYPH|nr:hypothetical protein [Falsochrobactrum sp. TDYN1]MBV2142636.1 hypothetical protein [Falsochrobactrum sp. TDYN1]